MEHFEAVMKVTNAFRLYQRLLVQSIEANIIFHTKGVTNAFRLYQRLLVTAATGTRLWPTTRCSHKRLSALSTIVSGGRLISSNIGGVITVTNAFRLYQRLLDSQPDEKKCFFLVLICHKRLSALSTIVSLVTAWEDKAWPIVAVTNAFRLYQRLLASCLVRGRRRNRQDARSHKRLSALSTIVS